MKGREEEKERRMDGLLSFSVVPHCPVLSPPVPGGGGGEWGCVCVCGVELIYEGKIDIIH